MSQLFSLLVLLLLPLAASAELTLQQLVDRLGSIKQRDNRFEETKESALLDIDLIQSGRLSFRAPNLLRKEITQPQKTLLEIHGDNLSVQQPGHPTRRVSLPEQPLLLAFSESFRALLAGDREALERHYLTELNGNWAAWKLRLLPKLTQMASLISWIEIIGSGDQIDVIVTSESGGDRTTTRLLPSQPELQ